MTDARKGSLPVGHGQVGVARHVDMRSYFASRMESENLVAIDTGRIEPL